MPTEVTKEEFALARNAGCDTFSPMSRYDLLVLP
jgi:hypothetical protein